MQLLAVIILILILSLIIRAQEGPSTNPIKLHWYKGNTHTHTLNSDGDSTPDEVVRWYREHGYNFLVLSDHNFLTEVEGLNSIYGAEGKFIVIKGEEITDRFGDKPIHVNGLNIDRLIPPQGGSNVTETIQRNVNSLRAASGVPHINHPNYRWTIGSDELKQVNNYKLFEIFNGHPYVNNVGGGGHPGLEEMWDMILTSGKLVYGLAVDDAHHFKRPWDKTAALPGKGWVVVRAEELSAALIMEAMERGDFYASTGVELSDYVVTGEEIRITIDGYRNPQRTRFTTQFIGQNGLIFSEVNSNPAVYHFRGHETYIRARIMDSNGNIAWTQPVIPGGK